MPPVDLLALADTADEARLVGHETDGARRRVVPPRDSIGFECGVYSGHRQYTRVNEASLRYGQALQSLVPVWLVALHAAMPGSRSMHARSLP